jgi:acyl-coenzyme A synthetase/AMP-(fatty) acid ligase
VLLVARKIEDFARRTPDAPAMIANLEPVSYREFDRRIRALRHAFAARGLKLRGVVVSHIGDLAWAWAVDMALRGLGHTTMAIRSPAELEDLGGVEIAAVVTLAADPRAPIGGHLAPGAVRIVLREADWSGDPGPATPPLAAEGGDHILLTSATTGRYKMIVQSAAQEVAEYEATRAQAEQMLAVLGPGAAMNYLDLGLWTSAAYPGSILIWSHGQTVIVHRSSDLQRSLTLPRIDLTTATPALVARLMAAPEGSFPRRDRMQLRIVAGALSERLFHRIRARLTNQIHIGVGSSEAGTWTNTIVESVEDLRWHRVEPNRRVEIVDENHMPLPRGQLGQVRVSQTGIASYLNDDAASATFFRDDWFYPGDLGVLREDGRLALFGRVTDVVNRQGDKLPAATFETEMQKHLDVDSVCLFSEQGAGADEELHVVIETPVQIDKARLQDAAQRCLGGFGAIHFHFLPELPRNEMGKVQRLKLRQHLKSLTASA